MVMLAKMLFSVAHVSQKEMDHDSFKSYST